MVLDGLDYASNVLQTNKNYCKLLQILAVVQSGNNLSSQTVLSDDLSEAERIDLQPKLAT